MENRTEDGNLEMFGATDDYLTDNNLSNLLIAKVIVNHLNSLHAHFQKYFPMNIHSGKESKICEPFISKLSDDTPVIKSSGRVCRFIKRQKFGTSIFETNFM